MCQTSGRYVPNFYVTLGIGTGDMSSWLGLQVDEVIAKTDIYMRGTGHRPQDYKMLDTLAPLKKNMGKKNAGRLCVCFGRFLFFPRGLFCGFKGNFINGFTGEGNRRMDQKLREDHFI